MKVILIQPPHYYGGQTRLPSFFPLGLGYIAKVLTDNAYPTEIFDIWAHQLTKNEVVDKISKSKFDVVGISALSSQYRYVIWLVEQIRKYHQNATIVLGGALATLSPEIVLSNTAVDICVIGEGEQTFIHLLENLNDFSKINGITYKKNGEIIKNPNQPYIKNLDSLKFPAWDLFPTEIYIKNSYLISTYYNLNIGVMNIVCGRGCPWNCYFCSKTFYGTRLRSIDNIISEVKELVDRYKINGIFFNDELLAVNKERIYDLCEQIEPLNLKWQCQARVNIVDYNLLKRLKSAGCVSIGYGIESGSQKILNNMNKKVTVKQAENAIKETYRAGLFPIIQMMYGYVGESSTTLQETIAFFNRSKAFYFGNFFITTPLPGTQLYDSCLKNNIIKDEEKYLSNLSSGYHGDRYPLVNLTNFNETDFYNLKKKTEKIIHFKSLINNPLLSIKFLYYNAIRFGWLKLLKKFSKKYLKK